MGEKTMGDSIYIVNEKTGEKVSISEIPTLNLSSADIDGLSAPNVENFSAEFTISEKGWDLLRKVSEPLDNLLRTINLAIDMYLYEVKE